MLLLVRYMPIASETHTKTSYQFDESTLNCLGAPSVMLTPISDFTGTVNLAAGSQVICTMQRPAPPKITNLQPPGRTL